MRLKRGESPRKKAPWKVGQVITTRGDGKLYLLLERKHAPWPSWESLGRFWQWRRVNLETGVEAWELENALEHFSVVEGDQ